MTDLAAYFVRIGYDGPREPTLEVLRRIHALHPAAIPFEAIDCLLDRGVDLAPEAVDAKLIHGRRGGYCFEHNSLLRRVLEALGFQVTGHAARVRWGMPAEPRRPRTHQVLRIEIEGESWLADVGFGGCVLTAPLRLELETVQETAHDAYRLMPHPEGVSLEVLRDGAWTPAWELSLEPCTPADYEMANWYTSTFPTSHFRHNLLAAKTTPQARYALLFNRFTTRPAGGQPTRAILSADGIEATLRDVFGLPVEPAWRPLIERAAAMAPD